MKVYLPAAAVGVIERSSLKDMRVWLPMCARENLHCFDVYAPARTVGLPQPNPVRERNSRHAAVALHGGVSIPDSCE